MKSLVYLGVLPSGAILTINWFRLFVTGNHFCLPKIVFSIECLKSKDALYRITKK